MSENQLTFGPLVAAETDGELMHAVTELVVTVLATMLEATARPPAPPN